MKRWYSRPVFFVRDTPASLVFFVEKLGFSPDWKHEEDGRAVVCQVNRDGFELILAQDGDRAGHGRVFISLDDPQMKTLLADIDQRRIPTRHSHWGMPVIEILDGDGNELVFSPPAEQS